MNKNTETQIIEQFHKQTKIFCFDLTCLNLIIGSEAYFLAPTVRFSEINAKDVNMEQLFLNVKMYET